MPFWEQPRGHKGLQTLLYTTDHSLGGGLSNLFAFYVAHKKEQNDENIRHFPKKITAMTFAAPVIGNADLQTEYQFPRETRISASRSCFQWRGSRSILTNSISFPFSLAIKGDSTKYVQNGMRNQSLFETKGTKWKSALSTRKPALRNCISILWITWLDIYSQCTEYESLYRKTRHFTNKPSKIFIRASLDGLIDWGWMQCE